MVNVSQRLLGDLPPANPDCSVLDLRALCRGAKYVSEAIKTLPEKPEPIGLARILQATNHSGPHSHGSDCIDLAITGTGIETGEEEGVEILTVER
jgi:hypothetical protein